MNENDLEHLEDLMVCLLIDDGRAPVGLVVHEDPQGVILHLFSFATGYLWSNEAGDILEHYPWQKIERVVKGRRMSAQEIYEQDGYTFSKAEELADHPAGYWNTHELGRWQNVWKAARG
jgi:hypothetical protein